MPLYLRMVNVMFIRCQPAGYQRQDHFRHFHPEPFPAVDLRSERAVRDEYVGNVLYRSGDHPRPHRTSGVLVRTHDREEPYNDQ